VPPVPRRRTFASGILPAAHSNAACASPSWLRLASYAGSRGTGSPSLSSSSRKPPSRERCGPAVVPSPRVRFLWRQDAGVSRVAARMAASQARRTLASPRLTQALVADGPPPVVAAGCRCFACRRQDGGESGAANLGFAPPDPSENRQDAGVSREFSPASPLPRAARGCTSPSRS
jgi:hypothetical protein